MSGPVEFPNHTAEDAPEAARPFLDEAEAKYGMIPNLFLRMAAAPSLVEAYSKVGDAFSRSSLDPREQQVVLLATSVRNGCEYCVGAHSVVADMSDVPTQVTDAIRDGEEITDPKLQALRRFTEQVVDSRGWPEPDEVHAFLDAGFDRQQVLEVVLGVGMKTLSNYTNHLVGTELDDAFAHRAWSGPSRS